MSIRKSGIIILQFVADAAANQHVGTCKKLGGGGGGGGGRGWGFTCGGCCSCRLLRFQQKNPYKPFNPCKVVMAPGPEFEGNAMFNSLESAPKRLRKGAGNGDFSRTGC